MSEQTPALVKGQWWQAQHGSHLVRVVLSVTSEGIQFQNPPMRAIRSCTWNEWAQWQRKTRAEHIERPERKGSFARFRDWQQRHAARVQEVEVGDDE